jgi:hypothetical protein
MSVVATTPTGYFSFIAIQIINIIVISIKIDTSPGFVTFPSVIIMFGLGMVGWALYLFCVTQMMARDMDKDGVLDEFDEEWNALGK